MVVDELRTSGFSAKFYPASPNMLPHCPQPINLQEPSSNSDQGRESPADSASSQETWPTANAIRTKRIKEERENDVAEQSAVRHPYNLDKLSLHDVARGRVGVISEQMRYIPDSCLDELKAQLRVVLEGSVGSQQRGEFLALQYLVQGRSDLTAVNLSRAHRAQLEILVSISTGIQAFLHPSIGLSQASLIEVFLHKRCRNIACQTLLPRDDCTCKICSARKGFCNFCMCVICNKFDFEVNSSWWMGCEMCSHWTHTDCAIRDGQIFMGVSKNGLGSPEMVFRCRACNKTSGLLEWVKEVFQSCVASWNAEALARELDYVCRIFRRSEDLSGRKLVRKCKDLLKKLKTGYAESSASKEILIFLQGIVPMSEEEMRRRLPAAAYGKKSTVGSSSASERVVGVALEGTTQPPTQAEGPSAPPIVSPDVALKKRRSSKELSRPPKRPRELVLGTGASQPLLGSSVTESLSCNSSKVSGKSAEGKLWGVGGALNNFTVPIHDGLADDRPSWVSGPASETARLDKRVAEVSREASKVMKDFQELKEGYDAAIAEVEKQRKRAERYREQRDSLRSFSAELAKHALISREQFAGHAERAVRKFMEDDYLVDTLIEVAVGQVKTGWNDCRREVRRRLADPSVEKKEPPACGFEETDKDAWSDPPSPSLNFEWPEPIPPCGSPPRSELPELDWDAVKRSAGLTVDPASPTEDQEEVAAEEQT